MNHHKHLDVRALDGALRIRRPDPATPYTTDSPALELFTDFERNPPPMLESSTSVQDAEAFMLREHASFKLVIGHDEDFRGIITLLDIRSSKLMRIANATGIPRQELTVSDVMIPRQQLHMVTHSALQRATVGAVLAALERLGERYLLVVDDEDESLRGLFSAREIKRRLHLPDMAEVPGRSVAAIKAALCA
jgi:CBS domain-containing protein